MYIYDCAMPLEYGKRVVSLYFVCTRIVDNLIISPFMFS